MNTSKKSVLRAKISECGSDSKKLHALVNNLMAKTVNPMPTSKNNKELADEFAEFLKTKS